MADPKISSCEPTVREPGFFESAGAVVDSAIEELPNVPGKAVEGWQMMFEDATTYIGESRIVKATSDFTSAATAPARGLWNQATAPSLWDWSGHIRPDVVSNCVSSPEQFSIYQGSIVDYFQYILNPSGIIANLAGTTQVKATSIANLDIPHIQLALALVQNTNNEDDKILAKQIADAKLTDLEKILYPYNPQWGRTILSLISKVDPNLTSRVQALQAKWDQDSPSSKPISTKAT